MNLRHFSITLLLIISTSCVFAQLRLGVKLSPGISPLRATVLSDTMSLTKEAKPLRFLAGLVVDYNLKDNYGVRTGLNFISKKYGYEIDGDQGSQFNDDLIAQYIQIPASLILHTNEVMLDSKIYVQLGMNFDIKVHDNIEELTNPLVTKVRFMDLSMVVASGLDMKLGTDTRAFGGIVYQRGFINQAGDTQRIDKKFKLQSGFIGIEAGILF